MLIFRLVNGNGGQTLKPFINFPAERFDVLSGCGADIDSLTAEGRSECFPFCLDFFRCIGIEQIAFVGGEDLRP